MEKDYFVTEVLRTVAEHFPTQSIFKGGTSLSKTWRLIDRFSEDVDLFPAPPLRCTIEADYRIQCGNLCFGPFPSFEKVQTALGRVRGLL